MHKLITILMIAATACDTTVDPATLIARDRVLGAKVTVGADATRAWPRPGETATVTWVSASPGPAPTFSWILAACPAATNSGAPTCAGPVFATSQTSGTAPALQLAIPDEVETDSIVVLGAICASGAPVVEATFAASCDDGSLVDRVSLHIFVAHDEATNHNPDIADAPFTIAGATWAAPEGIGCRGTLPEVTAGPAQTVLGVAFAAADRETFAVTGDPTPHREELQLSAFTTAGELIQQFAYAEADDTRPRSQLTFAWKTPSTSEIPDDGLPVTFTFVVRDLRGGLDATTRELCVVK
jgi:hypothetical protein